MNLRHGLLTILLCTAGLMAAADLETTFRNPPNEARPKTWWHWMNNFISKEGITRDLEAMKKAGIGGATILDISCFDTYGPVKTLSPEWYALVQHALQEAERLGLELTVHNCPGWSSSGGPWIRPEHAMKEIHATETVVEGGKEIKIKLPQVRPPKKFYRDIAVLAYPALPGDGFNFKDAKPTITTDADFSLKMPWMPDYVKVLKDPNILPGGIWSKVILVNPARAKRPQSFTFSFDKPFTAGSVRIGVGGPPWDNHAVYRISVSDDGKNFRTHYTSGTVPKSDVSIIGFSPVTAKYFRLSVLSTRENRWLPLYRVDFSPAVTIPEIAKKAFYKHDPFAPNDPFRKQILSIPENNTIRKETVLDLTGKMDRDGNLVWKAPAGKWTILRFGMIARNSGNHPATPEGRGLECDKLSKEGIDEAWRGMMAKIVREAGPLAGKSLKYTLIDSYEVGPQNWTDRMPQEFKRLRGYDPIPFLPILTGRCMESPEYSERFLQDFRRTVSDLFAEYYGKYYSELVHKENIGFVTEPYGGPFDDLLQGQYADVPMGEFWRGFKGVGNAKLASNIAHVNGRKFVQTETFTAGAGSAAWTSYPAVHKIQGDNAFCSGVNRFVFHSYAHQPWKTDTPGMTMGQWGFHFNRNNTLWEFYPGWLAYVARAQHLLQQGRYVADALYVAPEDTPVSAVFKPALPDGYSANCCDTRAFLTQVSVKNGRIVLKSGMEYAFLILPETEVLSPEVLEKTRQLLQEGATVLLGKRPVHAFGLKQYPSSDQKVSALASLLWGGLDGKTKTEKTLGKGRIFFAVQPGEILNKLGIKPDFSYPNPNGDGHEVNFIHRKTPDADLYFVANISKSEKPFAINAKFRASGRPEFWNAEDGTIHPVPVYRRKDGVTEIPMTLNHSGSIFVVFRREKENRHLTKTAWTAKTAPDRQAQNLVIRKALWRAKDKSAGRDVTDLLSRKIVNSTLQIGASAGELGGDSAPGKVKELYVEYTKDGKPETKTVPEWARLSLTAAPAAPGLSAEEPELRIENGKPVLYSAVTGTFSATDSEGKIHQLEITDVPKTMELSSDWDVKFQKNRGAPDQIVLKKLIPLNQHPQEGVKYFSGTAVYTKTIRLPEELFNGTNELLLDLGNVYDAGKVSVNGKDLGYVWHPPYRVDATKVLHPGKNTLEIQVANRWINRLIGDDRLPEDTKWKAYGKGFVIDKIPEWFLKGEKSPTGRIAFTTYKYWTKNHKLENSGLGGPVRLVIRKRAELK